MNAKNLFVMSLIAAAVSGCGGAGDTVGSDRVLGAATASNTAGVKKYVELCDSNTLVCTLSGTVNENLTLRDGFAYRLAGRVDVGDVVKYSRNGDGQVQGEADEELFKEKGVTLTIPAGMRISGLNTDSTLVINRGSKIQAIGTAAKPIIFDSLDANYDGQGEWGGILIFGFSPVYDYDNAGSGCVANGFCNVDFEVPGYGYYGGNDRDDSSGTLKYVVIAEAAKPVLPGQELNGLTLSGVGYGTTIDYVQVHNSKDDGIELFGGTVNLKHLVLTSNDDDDLDYDRGYQGNIQYVFAVKERKAGITDVQSTGNSPSMIEANTNGDPVLQTNAAVANGTFIHYRDDWTGTTRAPLLTRGNTQSTFDRIAVYASLKSKACFENLTSEGTSVGASNMLCDMSVNPSGGADRTFASNSTAYTATNIQPRRIDFDAVGAVADAEAIIASGNTTAINNGSGFQFDSTSYIGAINPNAAVADRNWMAGWTIGGYTANIPQ